MADYVVVGAGSAGCVLAVDDLGDGELTGDLRRAADRLGLADDS
jgi:hypothetical protein